MDDLSVEFEADFKPSVPIYFHFATWFTNDDILGKG